MIPENFIYFSLILNTISETNLRIFLSKNQEIQDIIQRRGLSNTNFIHNLHCTLFYRNSCLYNQSVLTAEEIYNKIEEEFEKEVDKIYKIKIIGWGWNNRALALLVDEKSINLPRLINHKYHITVYTFNNAKPVESNNIKSWNLFEDFIEIDCILSKTISK